MDHSIRRSKTEPPVIATFRNQTEKGKPAKKSPEAMQPVRQEEKGRTQHPGGWERRGF